MKKKMQNTIKAERRLKRRRGGRRKQEVEGAGLEEGGKRKREVQKKGGIQHKRVEISQRGAIDSLVVSGPPPPLEPPPAMHLNKHIWR